MRPNEPREGHASRIRSVYARYDSAPGEQRKRDSANRGNAAIVRERRQRLAQTLRNAFGEDLASVRGLDVGCGRAALLGWLEERGARAENLHGIDLLEDRIAGARALHPNFDLRSADARCLPYADDDFDLVVCSTIFSSIIEPEVAAAVAAEVRRVLAPGGAVLWYDVRLPNPRNPNTVAMTQARVRRLFPDLRWELRSSTVLPPLARRLGRLTPIAYPSLATIPFLRSHYLGLLRNA